MFLSINWDNALVVTFFGFAIVLVVLILLTFVLNLFGKMMMATKKKETNSAVSVSIEDKPAEGLLTTAESAAVAMALYQYFNAHDEESLILTLNNSEHPYHPWSSKIYGINNLNK